MTQRQSIKVARVDDRDRVIGNVARARVFVARANFRVVHIFARNHCGEILLQRLPDSHERHPARWGTSVAGYVLSGETYRQAATRKLREELHTEAVPKLLGKTSMVDQGSKKFISVFSLRLPGEYMPDPEHFARLRFVKKHELAKLIAASPEDFTPTLVHVVEYVDRQKLVLE